MTTKNPGIITSSPSLADWQAITSSEVGYHLFV